MDMLGIIDVQPTFMPGGELPVPDGGRGASATPTTWFRWPTVRKPCGWTMHCRARQGPRCIPGWIRAGSS